MIPLVLSKFIDLFVSIFNILLITRVIMSYFAKPGNRLFMWIFSLTEPVLAPVRRVLPVTPGVDFAPLAAFFLLQGAAFVIHALLGV
jgi:YggT family protein